MTEITVSSVDNDAAIEIIAGDDYFAADGRSFDFIEDESDGSIWPSLTSATVVFQARALGNPDPVLTEDLDVLVATGTAKSVRLELSADDTGTSLGAGSYAYSIVATLQDGHTVTLVADRISVAAA